MSVLKIKIVNDENYYLTTLYKKQIEKLNENLKTNLHPDSGFDLYSPKNLQFPSTTRRVQTKKMDLKIQCAMYDVHGYPSAFYMHPRSSISKTPFRLANNTGIIDSGYRGNLGAYFDCFSGSTEQITKGSRLLQICAPDLKPFRVVLVTNLDTTVRGEGGFGSSGK